MSSGPKEQKTTTAGSTSSKVVVPKDVQPLVTQGTGVAGTALTDLQQGIQGYELPPETLQALQSTAQGDYLFGGPQQQAFIDAARRAAQPGINSQFGLAGRGGSGLWNAAGEQSATDAFANLFQSERTNQLNAAQLLPSITQMPLQLQQQLFQAGSGVPASLSPLFGNKGTQQQTTTQPVYQTPWWQTALGAGTAIGGLAMPGPFGGPSALGNIFGGAKGLLGSFR